MVILLSELCIAISTVILEPGDLHICLLIQHLGDTGTDLQIR